MRLMSTASRIQPCLSRAGSRLQSALGNNWSRCVSTTPNSTKTTAPPKPKDYINLPSSSLAYHWDTLPPTPQQLQHADSFFSKQPPTFLWSAEKFHAMSFGDSPEICFLGRSNVGKSSLLNSLLNKKGLAHTSSKPGRTRLMNAFAVGGEDDNGKNRLVVLDMPGYGKGGRAEWGKEIMKYLSQRKQLKRAFLLIDATHGIKNSDTQLLSLFRQQGIPHQIVLSKVDRVLFPTARMPGKDALESRLAGLRRLMESCQATIQPDPEDISGALGELIACSAEKKVNGKKLGIEAVQHAMLQAAGLEYQPPLKSISVSEIVPYEEIFDKETTST